MVSPIQDKAGQEGRMLEDPAQGEPLRLGANPAALEEGRQQGRKLTFRIQKEPTGAEQAPNVGAVVETDLLALERKGYGITSVSYLPKDEKFAAEQQKVVNDGIAMAKAIEAWPNEMLAKYPELAAELGKIKDTIEPAMKKMSDSFDALQKAPAALEDSVNKALDAKSKAIDAVDKQRNEAFAQLGVDLQKDPKNTDLLAQKKAFEEGTDPLNKQIAEMDKALGAYSKLSDPNATAEEKQKLIAQLAKEDKGVEGAVKGLDDAFKAFCGARSEVVGLLGKVTIDKDGSQNMVTGQIFSAYLDKVNAMVEAKKITINENGSVEEFKPVKVEWRDPAYGVQCEKTTAEYRAFIEKGLDSLDPILQEAYRTGQVVDLKHTKIPKQQQGIAKMINAVNSGQIEEFFAACDIKVDNLRQKEKDPSAPKDWHVRSGVLSTNDSDGILGLAPTPKHYGMPTFKALSAYMEMGRVGPDGKGYNDEAYRDAANLGKENAGVKEMFGSVRRGRNFMGMSSLEGGSKDYFDMAGDLAKLFEKQNDRAHHGDGTAQNFGRRFEKFVIRTGEGIAFGWLVGRAATAFGGHHSTTTTGGTGGGGGGGTGGGGGGGTGGGGFDP